MTRMRFYQLPVLLILLGLLLVPLQWVSLHVGLRKTLEMTPLADRWRVYREFTHGHFLGVGRIVLMINIFRRLEGKEPVQWVRGEGLNGLDRG